MPKLELPVGYYSFHHHEFINYQLNRWHAEGLASKQDIESVASQITSFESYRHRMSQLADKALADGQLLHAAGYYRAAEFLTPPTDSKKQTLYHQFRDTFYKAVSDEPIEQFKVPFQNSFLAVQRLCYSSRPKGVILIHGGFDSFIEEFFGIWQYLAQEGYDVYAFDGPGQGATLKEGKIFAIHEWEHPVGAILDYFKVEAATLIGMSFGGYWCLRAAAFEPRIKKVVSWGVVYDWMEQAPSVTKKLVAFLLYFPSVMNGLVKLKMNAPVIKYLIEHGLYITETSQPLDVVKWLLDMNKEQLHSERITQDVLLFTGEQDRFQPPILCYKQKEALTHARSVTMRIFTETEQAHHHCQMGNLPLALSVLTKWLKEQT